MPSVLEINKRTRQANGPRKHWKHKAEESYAEANARNPGSGDRMRLLDERRRRARRKAAKEFQRSREAAGADEDEKEKLTRKEIAGRWKETQEDRSVFREFEGVDIRMRGGGLGYEVSWKRGSVPVKRWFKSLQSAEEFAEIMKEAQKVALRRLEATEPGSVELLVALARRMGAHQLFDRLMAECADVTGVPMAQAVEEFEQDLSARNGSARRAGWALKRYRYLEISVHQFTGPMLLDAVQGVVAPASLRFIRAITSMFWKFCVRRGYVNRHVQPPYESIVPGKKPPQTPEIFTPDEMVRLLASTSSPEFLASLVLGGFCGARPAEVHRLRWRDWRPETKSLVFPNDVTKTSRRRVCNVEDNVLAWMAPLAHRKNPDDLIVWISDTEVSKHRQAACAMAGVEWPQNALRHSYASYHLEKYQNAALTAKNCGHAVQILETNYMQITDQATANRWFSILPGE